MSTDAQNLAKVLFGSREDALLANFGTLEAPLFGNGILLASIVAYVSSNGACKTSLLAKYQSLIKQEIVSGARELWNLGYAARYAANPGFEKVSSLQQFDTPIGVCGRLVGGGYKGEFSERSTNKPWATVAYICFKGVGNAQDEAQMSAYLNGKDVDIPEAYTKFTSKYLDLTPIREYTEFTTYANTYLFIGVVDRPKIQAYIGDSYLGEFIRSTSKTLSLKVSTETIGKRFKKDAIISITADSKSTTFNASDAIDVACDPLPNNALKQVSINGGKAHGCQLLQNWSNNKESYILLTMDWDELKVTYFGLSDDKSAVQTVLSQAEKSEAEEKKKPEETKEEQPAEQPTEQAPENPVDTQTVQTVQAFTAEGLLTDITDDALKANGVQPYKQFDENYLIVPAGILKRGDMIMKQGSPSDPNPTVQVVNAHMAKSNVYVKEGSHIYRWKKDVVDAINKMGFNLNPGNWGRAGVTAESFLSDIGIFKNDLFEEVTTEK